MEKISKYCGNKCKGIDMKKRHIVPPSQMGMKRTVEQNKTNSESKKGLIKSPEHRKHIGEARKGIKNPMFGKSPSLKHRQKMAEMSGEKHWNWQGGITSGYMKSRNSLQAKIWTNAIFERDKYQCQKYGGGSGKLNAHHIQNFAQYPELRFAIDNGITFSNKAHMEFHKKYGRKNNTKEQLLEFLGK